MSFSIKKSIALNVFGLSSLFAMTPEVINHAMETSSVVEYLGACGDKVAGECGADRFHSPDFGSIYMGNSDSNLYVAFRLCKPVLVGDMAWELDQYLYLDVDGDEATDYKYRYVLDYVRSEAPSALAMRMSFQRKTESGKWIFVSESYPVTDVGDQGYPRFDINSKFSMRHPPILDMPEMAAVLFNQEATSGVRLNFVELEIPFSSPFNGIHSAAPSTVRWKFVGSNDSFEGFEGASLDYTWNETPGVFRIDGYSAGDWYYDASIETYTIEVTDGVFAKSLMNHVYAYENELMLLQAPPAPEGMVLTGWTKIYGAPESIIRSTLVPGWFRVTATSNAKFSPVFEVGEEACVYGFCEEERLRLASGYAVNLAGGSRYIALGDTAVGDLHLSILSADNQTFNLVVDACGEIFNTNGDVYSLDIQGSYDCDTLKLTPVGGIFNVRLEYTYE